MLKDTDTGSIGAICLALLTLSSSVFARLFSSTAVSGIAIAVDRGASCRQAGTITGFPNSSATLSVMKPIAKSLARWDGKSLCFGSASLGTLGPFRVRFSNS